MRSLQTSCGHGDGYTFECPNKCSGYVCGCDGEDPHCGVCHEGQGCSQCDYGYIKIGNNYPCVDCQVAFGVGCMHCSDYNGCNQCADGYDMIMDNECGNGVKYCKPRCQHDNNYPTPRPTSWTQPTPRPTW